MDSLGIGMDIVNGACFVCAAKVERTAWLAARGAGGAGAATRGLLAI